VQVTPATFGKVCKRMLAMGELEARSYEADFLNYAVGKLPDAMAIVRMAGVDLSVLPIVFVEKPFIDWAEHSVNVWENNGPFLQPALMPAGKVNTWAESKDYKIVKACLEPYGLCVGVRGVDDMWQCRGWDVYPCTLYPVFLKGFVYDGIALPPPA